MGLATVGDVMTHNVVSVTTETPYKDIVEKLAQYGVGAVPVIDNDNRVVGIVSEADLLHKIELSGLEPHRHLLERKRRRVATWKACGDVAGELMSSPAVTISPGASLPAVARMMEDKRVKRLPVVDEQGHLVGIVSRIDLLVLYLRPDATIHDEVREEVLRRMWIDPDSIAIAVDHGVVTLTGPIDRRSTAHIVVRLCEAVTGVIDVVDMLTYGYDDTADLRRRHLMGATVKETTP